MIQKKIENWSKKNNDKILHFIAGMLLSLLMIINWWFALLIVVVAVSKEIVDKKVRNTGFDRADIVATCLGAVPIVAVLLFYKYVM